MIVKNHPDAPKYGFLIRSDGSILVGDPGTYTENDLKEWFAKWIAMRQAGAFDEPPKDQAESPQDLAASSSQAPFVPLTRDEPKGDSKIDDNKNSKDEMNQAPLSPKRSRRRKRRTRRERIRDVVEEPFRCSPKVLIIQMQPRTKKSASKLSMRQV